MSYALAGSTEHQQMRDQLLTMSGGGAYPVIVIPTETDPDVCIYGRIEDSISFARTNHVIREADVTVVEEALPWV